MGLMGLLGASVLTAIQWSFEFPHHPNPEQQLPSPEQKSPQFEQAEVVAAAQPTTQTPLSHSFLAPSQSAWMAHVLPVAHGLQGPPQST